MGEPLRLPGRRALAPAATGASPTPTWSWCARCSRCATTGCRSRSRSTPCGAGTSRLPVESVHAVLVRDFPAPRVAAPGPSRAGRGLARRRGRGPGPRRPPAGPRRLPGRAQASPARATAGTSWRGRRRGRRWSPSSTRALPADPRGQAGPVPAARGLAPAPRVDGGDGQRDARGASCRPGRCPPPRARGSVRVGDQHPPAGRARGGAGARRRGAGRGRGAPGAASTTCSTSRRRPGHRGGRRGPDVAAALAQLDPPG